MAIRDKKTVEKVAANYTVSKKRDAIIMQSIASRNTFKTFTGTLSEQDTPHLKRHARCYTILCVIYVLQIRTTTKQGGHLVNIW